LALHQEAGCKEGTLANRTKQLAGELGFEFDSYLNMKVTISVLEKILYGFDSSQSVYIGSQAN
jgi:hypothetical protein